MSIMEVKVLYRYELQHFRDTATLELVEYKVVKETPKGYWIARGEFYNSKTSRKRWISSDARNRYAWRTKVGALKGYVRRKTYRNHCISSEMQRNDDTIREAKMLIRKHDKQGKK